jgi:hypothetical protein
VKRAASRERQETSQKPPSATEKHLAERIIANALSQQFARNSAVEMPA